MSINKTIERADVALEVLLKHDTESSCCHKFSEIMDEIARRWRDNQI